MENLIYDKSIVKAHRLFDLLIEKDVLPNEDTYIVLMKGYSRMRKNNAVFELLDDMGNRGVIPTEKTLSALTHAFATTRDIGVALSFFNKMKTEYGVKPSTISYNLLLKSCVKGRNLKAAKTVLEHMATSGVSKDVVTLNTTINVHAVCCHKDNARQSLKECRDLVTELDKDGVKANVLTFNTLLKLCARGSLTTEAFVLLNEMKTKNLNPDVVTYATLIDGISKNETLSTKEALRVSSEVVDEMKKEGLQLDAQAYTVLMHLAFKTRDLNRAVGLFHEMKEQGIMPTVDFYSSLIKYYTKLGDRSTRDEYLKTCLDLLTECEEYGIKMDVPGFVSLLSACASVGSLESALKVWNKINSQKIVKSVSMYTAMINVYFSARDLSGAISLFAKMKRERLKPTVITYGTMIKSYAKLGDPSTGDAYLKPCLDLMRECEQLGIVMSLEGYTSLLSACANVANLERALEIWSKVKEAKTKADVFAFTAMIRVCLSADEVDRAFALLNEMKTSGVKPNAVTFRTFIAYSIRKKDRAGARKILDEMKALDVQPDENTLRKLRDLQLD